MLRFLQEPAPNFMVSCQISTRRSSSCSSSNINDVKGDILIFCNKQVHMSSANQSIGCCVISRSVWGLVWLMVMLPRLIWLNTAERESKERFTATAHQKQHMQLLRQHSGKREKTTKHQSGHHTCSQPLWSFFLEWRNCPFWFSWDGESATNILWHSDRLSEPQKCRKLNSIC